ncbi:hypothetical protein AMECASPLE_017839 [Ameca splendens]|uniref:Uncharacterized protein n=1 Tax=Ameca splendens TaxID=208324 RepID=A0ABV0YDM1_9TELE
MSMEKHVYFQTLFFVSLSKCCPSSHTSTYFPLCASFCLSLLMDFPLSFFPCILPSCSPSLHALIPSIPPFHHFCPSFYAMPSITSFFPSIISLSLFPLVLLPLHPCALISVFFPSFIV